MNLLYKPGSTSLVYDRVINPGRVMADPAWDYQLDAFCHISDLAWIRVTLVSIIDSKAYVIVNGIISIQIIGNATLIYRGYN